MAPQAAMARTIDFVVIPIRCQIPPAGFRRKADLTNLYHSGEEPANPSSPRSQSCHSGSQVDSGDEDVFELPITDTFDLHTVPPRDVAGVVEAYVEAARDKGFRHLRLIHGKGIGVQRETVRRVLSRTACVESFQTAPEGAGGWGATLVTLRQK